MIRSLYGSALHLRDVSLLVIVAVMGPYLIHSKDEMPRHSPDQQVEINSLEVHPTSEATMEDGNIALDLNADIRIRSYAGSECSRYFSDRCLIAAV